MIKISNDEPVILEMALRPKTDFQIMHCAQRVYDKKNAMFIKERFISAAANAALNFALGVES